MPKWLRYLISALLALLFFAGTFPNAMGGGKVFMGDLAYILCLTVIPFLIVVLSVGRSRIWERIGWGVQILPLAAAIVR